MIDTAQGGFPFPICGPGHPNKEAPIHIKQERIDIFVDNGEGHSFFFETTRYRCPVCGVEWDISSPYRTFPPETEL